MKVKKKKIYFTDKQREWAKMYMETGKATLAASIAYDIPLDTPDHKKYAASLGAKNRRNPVIQEYMRSSAELATKTIVFLAENAENERVRLSAAQDILDRLGYKAPDKIEIDDRRELTDDDYEAIRRVQSILSGVKIEEIKPVEEQVVKDAEYDDKQEALQGTVGIS